MPLFGDGVVAALRPRVASEYPPQAHKASLKSAEALYRLIGVLGAGGKILALGFSVRRYGSLIKTD